MFGLFVISVLTIGTLGNAVDTGAITLDPPAIHKEKAKIEHVYNLNK